MPGPTRRRGTIVAVEGISGSGKTTSAARLARALGATLLPEAVDRLRPRPSLAIRSTTELVRLELRLLSEDARRFREAERAARDGSLVVADTGFLGPLTYSIALAEIGEAEAAVPRAVLDRAHSLLARGRWGLPDRVVWLETGAAERRRRVRRDPVRHPPTYAERHERVGARERALYRGPLARVLDGRIAWVNGSGPVGTVTRRLVRSMRSGPGRAAPASLARRTLAALATTDRVSGNR